MGVLKARDPVTGSWIPVTGTGLPGPAGPEGPAGPPGPAGVASIIIGDFGAVATPADLPIDGLIPINWDGPGNPAAPYQMGTGQSLYYDKAGDPLDGHLFQYISTVIDPSGWLDIGMIQGPPGPAPPGGLTGQALVKLSDADGHIGWDDISSGGGGLPAGGATGDTLIKNSNTDGDASWGLVNVSGGTF